MSVYWRWVVFVGGVSALATLLSLFIRTEMSFVPSWLTSFVASTVVALAAVPIRLAEAGVIKSAFPRLSVRDYIAYSMPLILLPPMGDLARLSTGLIVGDTVSVSEPSGIALHVDVLILVLLIALMIKFLFLHWRAIEKVAEGRKAWRNTILLGCAGAIIAVLVGAKLAGLGMHPGDMSTWPDVLARLPMTVIGTLAYALISGIGVARLRPLPETMP